MAPRNNGGSGSSNQDAEVISNDVAKAEIDKKYHEENQKNKITAPFLLPYPEPEEVRDQIINLADLEDPPDEFEIPGLTSRNPIMPNSCALVRFHFWNINPGKLHNGEMRLKAFRKLFYSQDEKHAVRSMDELCDLRRDAGPRLLKPEVLQRLHRLPISRHYPDYTGDADWEEQRSRPALPTTIAPAENTRNLPPDRGGSDSLVQEETPPHLNIIRETLEKLLIQLRYHDLEVPQTQASSTYRRYLPPEKIRLFLDTNHNVDPAIDGMDYVSRERGPIGDINDVSKTRFDCILMAGKFLDAGLTRIDMEEFGSRGVQETHSHRTFVSMIKYDLASPQICKRMRNTLHQFCQELAPTSFEDLLGKTTILRRQFSYTTIKLLRCDNGHERPIAETKGTLACLQNGYTSEEYAGSSMQEVMQSMFPQRIEAPFRRNSRRHDVCGFNDCNKDISQSFLRHSMPLRLAVKLPSHISPQDHTSEDIRINLFNQRGEEEVVVYRWIGGVYSDTEVEEQSTHYRVYWSEAVRGEKPTKNIRMYDPRYAQGRVIDGIAPSQRGQIPEAWWSGKFKPVLFYERVLNPNPLDVTLAAAVLGDMHHAIGHDKFILQVHEPWRPISARLNLTLPHGLKGEHDYISETSSIQVDDQDGGFEVGNSQPFSSGPHKSANQAQSSTYQMSQSGQFNHLDNRGYLSNGQGNFPNEYSSSMQTTMANNTIVSYPQTTFQSSLFSDNPYENNYDNTVSQRLQPDTTAGGSQEENSLGCDALLSNMEPDTIFSNLDNSAVPSMAMNGEALNGYLQNMSLMTPGIQPQNSAASGCSQTMITQMPSQEQQQVTWNPSHNGNAYTNLQTLPTSQNYPATSTTSSNYIPFGATNPSQPTGDVYSKSQVSYPVEHQSGSAIPNGSQEVSLDLGGLNQDHSEIHGASHTGMKIDDAGGPSLAKQGNGKSRNGSSASTQASRGFVHPVQTNLESALKRGPDTEQSPEKRS
ncbi:hypothetical protein UA08_03258 [Talaromyces atroroseus]|uniref:Uncharacterized protein n=1 Tax=Talaromyces atroroseus TaxID=1441469 RepID=A0A225AIA7_TALAT|nr:hypothetical protein UA08_03258 [Talaromyces atroroseus]OKL61171.1 hypothetical protein UA08_03258 [Talaromyces atroroseus]